MLTRRIGATLIAAVVATTLVAAPSAAEPVPTSLHCSAPSGSNTDVTVNLTIAGLAEGTTTDALLEFSVNGYPRPPITVDAGTYTEYVAENVLPAHARMGSGVYVSATVNGETVGCHVNWSPIVVKKPVVPASAAPDTFVTVTSLVDTARNPNAMIAHLEYRDGKSWKTRTSELIAEDGSLTFTFRATQSRDLRVALYSFETEGEPPLAVSAVAAHNVPYSTLTIASKSTKVLQGEWAKVVVLRGGYATTGTASLQRKTSSGWTTIKTASIVHGASALTWTPSATYTYRIAMKPTYAGTTYSAAFTVTYLPRITLTGPSSVKRGATATFTVTHHLAIPFYAYLQRWDGAKWVTVNTFVPTDDPTKVSAKVSSTSKWRVAAANWTSKTLTVTTY